MTDIDPTPTHGLKPVGYLGQRRSTLLAVDRQRWDEFVEAVRLAADEVITLMAAAFVAALLPARHAASINPTEVLRKA